MKTKFENIDLALESLNELLEEIEESSVDLGLFSCVAMGSITIEFASSSSRGEEDKLEAKKKVTQWLLENNVTLENEAEAMRAEANTDLVIEGDWWTTDEF